MAIRKIVVNPSGGKYPPFPESVLAHKYLDGKVASK
jgi:hypothetical protein